MAEERKRCDAKTCELCLQNGNSDERRVSLPPPPRHCNNFADYCENNTPLGRTPHVKMSRKHFKAHVYMSTEFPLSTDQLLDILEMVAPKFKHIEKLRKFCLVRCALTEALRGGIL